MARVRWLIMLVVASSQRGKSLMGEGLPILHTTTEHRMAVAYVLPAANKLDQVWSGKLQPMIYGAGYGDWLPVKGPGARGGKPVVLTLHDPKTQARAGLVYFMAAGGGGKETSTASVTARTVVVGEADDFASAAHLGLTERRTRSYGDDYRIYISSTVNDRAGRDDHPVLIAYQQSTRSRLWYACPICKRYQPLEWERIKYDDLDCGYQCAHCPAIWTEAQRHLALDRWLLVHAGQSVDEGGRVTGDAPAGRSFGLLAWDLEFHRASMRAVIDEHRLAVRAIADRSDHGPMKQFHYKVLCRDYRADIEELEHGADLTWQSLLDRSASCKWGPALHTTDRDEGNHGWRTYSRHHCEPPQEARFVAVGVDVQNNRLYWSALAYALDMTSWAIGWGTEYARLDQKPWSRAELFAVFDRLASRLPALAPQLDFTSIYVDVGDFTDDLTAWLRGQRRPWRPIKGVADFKAQQGDVAGVIGVRQDHLLIDSDNSRELVHQALRRPNGTAGALHLPRGLNNTATDRTFPQHLLGERLTIDPKTRKPKLIKSGRWDYLDATKYAHAGMRLHIAKTPPPNTRRSERDRDSGDPSSTWNISSNSWE